MKSKMRRIRDASPTCMAAGQGELVAGSGGQGAKSNLKSKAKRHKQMIGSDRSRVAVAGGRQQDGSSVRFYETGRSESGLDALTGDDDKGVVVVCR